MIVKLEGKNRTTFIEATAVAASTIQIDADEFDDIETDEYEEFLCNAAIDRLGADNGYYVFFGDIDERFEPYVLKIIKGNMEEEVYIVFGGYTILNDNGVTIESAPDVYTPYFGNQGLIDG